MAKFSMDMAPVEVTYRPLDPHDPNVTTWNGVEFQANVPVLLDPAVHFIVVDVAKEVNTSDGSIATKTRPTKIPMIEIAKGNPSFEVAGFPRAVRVKPTKRVPPPGAEWTGTDRDELVQQMAQITDFDPNADALVVR